MKSILITAGVAGVVLAGAIYYVTNKGNGKKQLINVEDGFAVEA